jgi:hypothetical protein
MTVRILFTKFTIVLLGFVALISVSCDDIRKHEAPPDVIYEADPNASPNTGRFVMYVFNNDDKFTPLDGVQLSVFNTFQDLENNIFLQSQNTRSKGRADFNYLNAGNYYVRIFYQSGDRKYDNVITVQVQAQKTLTRNFVLR